MPYQHPEKCQLVREQLRAYMQSTESAKGPEKVEAEILACRAQRGHSLSHDEVKRCRDDEALGRRSFEIIYKFLILKGFIFDPDVVFPDQLPSDPAFNLLTHTFAVKQNNLELSALLIGNYSLFFKSEDFLDRVVHRAIKFQKNNATAAFEIEEPQLTKQPRRIERWTEYYFARKERIVIILKGERRLESVPKFYVLHTPHFAYSDDGVEYTSEIGGITLKLGTGVGRSAFAPKVLLRRDPEAFKNCDIVSPSDIPPDVLPEI
jgi:hypothetical protein